MDADTTVVGYRDDFAKRPGLVDCAHWGVRTFGFLNGGWKGGSGGRQTHKGFYRRPHLHRKKRN